MLNSPLRGKKLIIEQVILMQYETQEKKKQGKPSRDWKRQRENKRSY
jgi:hypothetical protein